MRLKPNTRLIVYELTATVLFMWHTANIPDRTVLSSSVPLVVMLLIVVNSVWFTRLGSWVIFATSFFSFLVLLSAFTLRWRLENGFQPAPFYRAMAMYASFIYVSLAQIKIRGAGPSSAAQPDAPPSPTEDK